MWYVIQVTPGQERKTCDLVKASIDADSPAASRILKECFVPVYQVEQKFRGEYRTVERNLFPGYVIAVSANVGELNDALRGVGTFTRILGNDEAFIPLDRTEAAFINSFTAEKRRVILTSRAVAEGDSIRVVEGPLVGREGWIRKVNRRKGTALIETQGFDRNLVVEVGLAVVAGT